MSGTHDPLAAEELFHELLDLDEAARATRLAEVDTALRTLVTDLLRADSGADTAGLQGRLGTSCEEAPSRIGPYSLDGLLGEGGMGSVYRARQEHPVRRTVALKLLRVGFAGREARVRFDAERELLARMDHPNVARVLDAGELANGRPWIAMELVDGPTITAGIAERRIGVEGRVALMARVCRAVEHAHQKGVVHRDLKPSNVLLADSDDGPLPKVIDFGIAKVFGQSDGEALDLTRADGFLGTPDWMSPEHIRHGAAAVDTRSDVWALGVLLYELLAGRRPFRSTGTAPAQQSALWTEICERDPLPPSRQAEPDDAARIRGDLDAVVLRALAKDPERRCPSAAALAEDLEAWLRDEPVAARVPSARERFARLVRRHRLASAAVTFVVVATSIAFVTTRSALDLARSRLTDFRRMADARRIVELRELGESVLTSPWAERLPRSDEWLARFEALRARLPEHRAVLEGLEQPGEDLSDSERRWIRTTTADVVAEIESFAGVDGLAARVRAARDEAERVVAASQAADWDACVRGVADPGLCPRYEGLTIGPQAGLVPLGRRAHSGLWEFWHVASGARPEWTPDECRTRPEDGIVLVLVPGGAARIGCMKLGLDDYPAEHMDPRAGHVEQPVHTVELEPFFLGRFEVTQAQWRRMAGENPSRFVPGLNLARGSLTETNPVEQVDWLRAVDVLAHFDLLLPTEVQWEAACRAGTVTAFWTGQGYGQLRAVGSNLADEASRHSGFPEGWVFEAGWDDGHAVHAPVGSFPPNPLGLHDMHGNVAEWCRDRFSDYALHAARAGDGARIDVDPSKQDRVVRGGSFNHTCLKARSSARDHAPAAHRVAYRGLRVALPLR